MTFVRWTSCVLLFASELCFAHSTQISQAVSAEQPAQSQSKRSNYRDNTRRKRPLPTQDDSDCEDDDDYDERPQPRQRRAQGYDDDRRSRRRQGREQGREDYYKPRHQKHPASQQVPQDQPSSDESVVVKVGTEGKEEKKFGTLEKILAFELIRSIVSGNEDSGDVANVTDAAGGG